MSKLHRIAPILGLLLLGFPPLAPAQDKSGPDLFQPNSVWVGSEEGDERKPNAPQARGHHAELTVTERKDNTFVANYWINVGGVRHSLQLEGKIEKGKIVAKATKILRGAGWPPGILDMLWNGEVRESELILQRKNAKNLVRTARLSLDDKASSRGDRKGGKD